MKKTASFFSTRMLLSLSAVAMTACSSTPTGDREPSSVRISSLDDLRRADQREGLSDVVYFKSDDGDFGRVHRVVKQGQTLHSLSCWTEKGRYEFWYVGRGDVIRANMSPYMTVEQMEGISAVLAKQQHDRYHSAGANADDFLFSLDDDGLIGGPFTGTVQIFKNLGKGFQKSSESASFDPIVKCLKRHCPSQTVIEVPSPFFACSGLNEALKAKK